MTNSGTKAISLLALAGGCLKDIDNSHLGLSSDTSLHNSNRLDTSMAAIQNAEYRIRNKAGMNVPSYQEPLFQEPSFSTPVQPNFTNISMSNPSSKKLSREERINKLLGKDTLQVQSQSEQVNNSEYQVLLKAFKEALEPVVEQLEDIAVVDGILVQRIERLIELIDPESAEYSEPESINNVSSYQDDEFQDIKPPAEVYNPEVSMTFTEDEEDTAAPAKKSIKNTK